MILWQYKRIVVSHMFISLLLTTTFSDCFSPSPSLCDTVQSCPLLWKKTHFDCFVPQRFAGQQGEELRGIGVILQVGEMLSTCQLAFDGGGVREKETIELSSNLLFQCLKKPFKSFHFNFLWYTVHKGSAALSAWLTQLVPWRCGFKSCLWRPEEDHHCRNSLPGYDGVIEAF